MRHLIYALNLTLDGCCDHTRLSSNDEIYDHYTQLMRDVDLLVYGRKTDELMVPFWPDIAKNQSGQTKAMNDFAEAFDANKIVVFSRSLERAERKDTLVRANLETEILKLKQEQGRNILTGGVSLPSQLIELGLVDEFRFIVQPLVVGEGRRLLEDVGLPERLELKLVESKIFDSGYVALRYLKQGS